MTSHLVIRAVEMRSGDAQLWLDTDHQRIVDVFFDRSQHHKPDPGFGHLFVVIEILAKPT